MESEATGGRPRRPNVGVGVGVLVTRDGALLLVRRAYHGAGTWATPGGYLDQGEAPEACAVREVREETGVAIAPGDLSFRGITNDVWPEDHRHSVTLWFATERSQGDAWLAQPDESAAVGWFPPEEFPGPLYRSLENYLAGRVSPPLPAVGTGGVDGADAWKAHRVLARAVQG